MICHNRKILYLHPSKTAGTSIEFELLRGEGLEPTNLSGAQKQVWSIWTGDSRQHWPYWNMLDNFPFLREWDSVCSIRHPYERAVSEFRYQLIVNKKTRKSEAHKARDVNSAIKNGSIWKFAWAWHGQPQINYIGPHTKIIRFETLHEDVERVFGFRLTSHRLPTPDLIIPELNNESKELIQQKWPNDFEPLGYTP